MKKVHVYISLPIGFGKMPNKEQKEAAQMRCQQVAAKLSNMGYVVMHPFNTGASSFADYKTCINFCCDLITHHRPIMYFLDGWQSSPGCGREFLLSNEINLEIRTEEHGDMHMLEYAAREIYNIHPEVLKAMMA